MNEEDDVEAPVFQEACFEEDAEGVGEGGSLELVGVEDAAEGEGECCCRG